MTPLIRNLELSDALIVNISTASQLKKIDAKTSKVFCKESLSKEEIESLYQETAGLNPIYGKIIAISVGNWKDGEYKVHTYQGEEVDILRDFIKSVKSRNFKMVLYNPNFELPYIRKRFFHHNLQGYLTTGQGMDAGAKPWDLDTVLINLHNTIKGIGWNNDSLEEVCHLLNIGKGDIDGSEITPLYHKGKIKEIVENSEKNNVALLNLFLKLQNFK